MSLDTRPKKYSSTLVWILLFSLLPQGITVAVGDRSPDIAVFDLVMLAVLGWMAYSLIFGSFRPNLTETALLSLGAAFLFANLLSFFLSTADVFRSMLAIKVFLFGLLAYILVRSTVQSRASLEAGINALVIWAVAVSGMLIYQLVTQWQFSFQKDVVGISMGRSNYLAAMLLPVLPIAVCRSLELNGSKRLLYAVLAVVIFVGLLITASRGAFVSLAVTFVITLPLSLRLGLRLWHLAVVLALIAGIVVSLPSSFLQTFWTMIEYRLVTPDYQRIELWTTAWNAFLRHPLFGVGPNVIYLYNRQFAIEDLYSHNFVLNVLADLGMVGAIPFFSLIALVFVKGYRICKASLAHSKLKMFGAGSFIALIATLIHGFVEPTFEGQQYLVVFFVIIALTHTFGAINVSDHQPQRER